jgi:hypothetical protein
MKGYLRRAHRGEGKSVPYGYPKKLEGLRDSRAGSFSYNKRTMDWAMGRFSPF